MSLLRFNGDETDLGRIWFVTYLPWRREYVGGFSGGQRLLDVCFCEQALYCSKRCQLAAWGEHSAECLRLRAANEGGEKTEPRRL
jgi:hypothetical protein